MTQAPLTEHLFSGSSSLIRIYTTSSPIFDGMIYLIFFTSIAQVTIGRRYWARHDRGSKGLVISIGMAMAIASSIASHRAGWSLGELAPLAWLIACVVLGLLLLGVLSPNRSQRHPFESQGQRSPAPNPPPPHSQHSSPHPLHQVIQREHHSISTLLDALADSVRLHGISDEAAQLLLRIASTQRDIDREYHTLLVQLAKMGWRRDPDKQMLGHDLESLIQDLYRHNGIFNESLRLAEAAIHGGNVQLLRECITRMQLLEQKSAELIECITVMLTRLESASSSAHRDGSA